jgi:predicted secreted protein
MKQSLQKYRRLGALGYARWVCEANGVEFDDEMVSLLDNHAIHACVEGKMAPVPAPANEPAPLVEEDVVNPFPADIQEYDSLTVAELRALCKERGLPVYGTKAEIILRLKQNDEGVIPEEDPESPAEEAALEGDSEAPTDEVAASNGEETNEKDSSDKQEPVIEE